jgi:hypothetical protein
MEDRKLFRVVISRRHLLLLANCSQPQKYLESEVLRLVEVTVIER